MDDQLVSGALALLRLLHRPAPHEYLGYNAGRDFERRIIVKVNAPEVLRKEMRRPGWGREHIAIGTACGPHEPLEGRYRLTRCRALAQSAKGVL